MHVEHYTFCAMHGMRCKKRRRSATSTVNITQKHIIMKTNHLLFKSLLIGLFLWICGSVRSQERFHVMVDYHYNLGLSENFFGYTLSRGDAKMYGHSLHISALYRLTSKFAIGAGMGADHYANPDYNTFPLFATAHYAPLSRTPDVYLYSNAGYGIIKGVNAVGGLLWDIGVGYKKMVRKHFGWNFQCGYNLKEFGFDEGDSNWRHSISLGVGLIF